MKRRDLIIILLVFAWLIDFLTTYTLFKILGMELEYEKSYFVQYLVRSYGWAVFGLCDLFLFSIFSTVYVVAEKFLSSKSIRKMFIFDLITAIYLYLIIAKIFAGILNNINIYQFLTISVFTLDWKLDFINYIILGFLMGYVFRSYYAIHHHKFYFTEVRQYYVPLKRVEKNE